MIHACSRIGMTIAMLGCWFVLAAAEPSSPNLVENGGMEIAGVSPDMVKGWQPVSPREEVSPQFGIEIRQPHSGKQALSIQAVGSPGTFGYWSTNVKLDAKSDSALNAPFQTNSVSEDFFLSGTHYQFTGYFKTRDVESIAKSVLIIIRWNGHAGEELFCEYISHHEREGEWYKASQIVTAPRGARSAHIELVFKWARRGVVFWDDFSMVEVPPPPPRKIRVAAVSYEPPTATTPEKNRHYFADKVAEAGKAGADIVCLGEGITIVSTNLKSVEAAEPVPGPTSQLLGEVAKRNRLYVIAGIYEREGSLVYNTALLIGRRGEIVGKYRKTHLPETEVLGGVTPGDSYPVFSTDFGTIGIEICYDNFFPEVARTLAIKGAEIIFLPIWGDVRGDGYAWDIAARSRALDNGVFLVSSIYTTKRSLIINPNGRVISETGGNSGMVLAVLDLNARTYERWLSVGSYGEWKSLYPSERRIDTYGVLAAEEKQPQ